MGILGVAVLLTWATIFQAAQASEPVSTTERAQQILDATGIRGGLVVHLGCGDGRLTAALRANDSFMVQGLDWEVKNVERARTYIQSLGFYGPVSVEQLTSARLPYADNLVNLIVAEDLGQVPMAEVLRALAPLGVTYLKQGGNWSKTVKPWPKDIDEWTHYLHGADNNAVAQDSRVGPPRRLQWCCEPLWSRSHAFNSSLCAMVSAKGRLFYIVDEGLTSITKNPIPEKWTLIARDAFNGVLLWKRPMTKWGSSQWKSRELRTVPKTVLRSLVAENDRVYVTLGYGDAVSILDAASGREIMVCEKTQGTSEIRCCQGILLANKGGTQVMALDALSGKRLWQAEGKIQPLSLAAQGGRVFYQDQQTIVCRSAADGRPLWQVPQRQPVALVVHQDRVLLTGAKEIKAIAAESGKDLWTADAVVPQKVLFVANQALWFLTGNEIVGHDLLTGNPRTKIDAADVYSAGHHHRCYQPKATEDFLITQNRGAEFISLTGGAHTENDWIRGACTYGILPCNGMLYVPPHPCFCYPGAKLTGFNVLAPAAAEKPAKDEAEEGPRLVRGPAYEVTGYWGQVTEAGDASSLSSPVPNRQFPIPDDWPTYRHDAARSGAVACNVPPDPAAKWSVDLHGQITPPVVYDGRLYVAAKNQHTLYALEAQTGRRLWQFTAGGPIDSPPTIHGDLVLLGCANGSAYCLRTSDGAFVWRFRAAPSQRQIIAMEQLESPWRVHGSVLVKDGVAYLTAGRSSFLDGGIWIFALDPRTGQVLYETHLDTWTRLRDDAKGKPFFPAFHIEGACSDILVSQDDFLYLGQFKFDRKLVRQELRYIMPPPKATEVADTGREKKAATKGSAKEARNFDDSPFIWYMDRSHPGMVEQYEKTFGGLTFGEQPTGLHLMPMTGFLDDSWFNRTFWTYSATRPGSDWAHSAQSTKVGELLVVGPTTTYGVQAYAARAVGATFAPGEEGYILFAEPNDHDPPPLPPSWRARKPARNTPNPWTWSEHAPIRMRGMVLAGQTLFVAGPPDIVDPHDPMAAFEGRKGGVLRAYAASDGKRLAECKLDAPPTFDGLIAAGGCLFLSTVDGKVVCLTGRQ
jgi:outer membrane protein assembly factor BamB